MVYSIQQIRAFAAILIVMSHLHNIMLRDGSPHFSFSEVNIVFTFAAGFLFQYLSINEPFRTFIKRRAINVLIPYVLISIPAILLYTVAGKSHPNVDLSQIPEWFLPIYLLLTGLQLGPLWFVPMIFLIYFATPLIRYIDRSSVLYAVFIPLTVLLGIFVFKRPEFSDNPVISAFHYLPVFLIGMACSRYHSHIETLSAKVWGWLPAALLLVGLAVASPFVDGMVQYPMKIVMLISLFVVASRTAEFRYPWIDLLAKYSFGIFFLHGYFVGVLRMLGDKNILDLHYSTPLLFVSTAIVTLLCVGVIYATKRVFGKRSRWLVGA